MEFTRHWTICLQAPIHHFPLFTYYTILCKSDDVSKYGYEKVLHALLQDIKSLKQDGIFISLLGRRIKGTIQVVVADNIGAHSLAGLNESFYGGNICHFCTGTKADIQTRKVKSGTFQYRTKDLHHSHVTEAQEKGVSCFGVKGPCVLTESLRHFSVLTGYPPDLMHDIFEGIVPVELAHCLASMISKKYFSLDTLNSAILHFHYKWSDKKNKPHIIPQTFSKRKTIGGNAHENWTLLRFLTFIIGHIVPENEKAW